MKGRRTKKIELRKSLFCLRGEVREKAQRQSFWTYTGMANTKINKKMLLGDGREREAVLHTRGWESTERKFIYFAWGRTSF